MTYTYRIVLICLFFQFNAQLFAQDNHQKTVAEVAKYEYYIYISGIQTREDVLNLQSVISEKQGVTYFMSNRYPVRYFTLRSVYSINQSTFKSWLPHSKFVVEVFGNDPASKEKAILFYNKNVKLNR